MYHLRPAKQKWSFIKDADVLLRYWEYTRDNSQLNLLELPQKVITLLALLLYKLRISATALFDINSIAKSNDMCIFYTSDLVRCERRERRRDKRSYKKFGNVSHKNFLFLTVTIQQHNDTIARWSKIHPHRQDRT